MSLRLHFEGSRRLPVEAARRPEQVASGKAQKTDGACNTVRKSHGRDKTHSGGCVNA